MRLDKYLADMGVGTRSEVKNLIRKGVVLINGDVCKKPEEKVELSDSVLVNGKDISYVEKEYYMLHKPAGVLSATSDKHCKTVLDLIDEKKRKDLFPVGRLDKDTEGLLLITNDGDLAHRLLSPKKHVSKVYYVEVDGKITQEKKQQIEEGVEIEKGIITKPSKLRILSNRETFASAELTIYEGKFHQVKRMFEAVELTVTYLKRLSMGTLILDEELEKGAYRPLTQKELEELEKGT